MAFGRCIVASACFAIAVHSTAVNVTTTNDLELSWGSIGDSWNSGIAWSDVTSWDNNAGGCLRAKRAYTGQMIDDMTWIEPGYSTRWTWSGCSGAQLVDMAQGRNQIEEIKNNPRFVVMTAGGINAHVGDVVSNCVYQADGGTDYGPPYHRDSQGVGKCKQAIQQARDYIEGGGLGNDFAVTLNDLFNRQLKRYYRSRFTLYVTGYVHFWNVDTESCDKVSWKPPFIGEWRNPPPNIPLLTRGLRRDMNDLLEAFNRKYVSVCTDMMLVTADCVRQREVIDGYQAPPDMNVRYVDISHGFNRHRFCEVGENIFDDFNGGAVWIWNIRAHARNVFETKEDGSRLWKLDASNLADFVQHVGGSFNMKCPENTNAGWLCRMFHPTSMGHQAIKNSIIEALQRDRIPGVNLDYRPSDDIFWDSN
jgi:hypothetical protein